MKPHASFLALLVGLYICSDWYVHCPTVTVSPQVHDCLQKYADVGPCKNAKTSRYTFNPTTKECKVFEYGGCGGSNNNFFTLAHCKSSCDHLIKEICNDVPGNKDPCIGAQITYKYTYNAQTKGCEKFIYSGCGGYRQTANVFDKHVDCLNDCRSLVFNKAAKPELFSGLGLVTSVNANQKECVQHCRVWTDGVCIGVAHDNTTQICHLLSNSLLDEEQDIFVYQTGLDLLIDPKVTVTILAFRFSSGVGGDPIVVYDNPLQTSSLSEVKDAYDMTTPLTKTYRSAILDNWKTYKIEQVVIAYKKSTGGWGEIVFNAENSDHKGDWMKQNKLVSSPWGTLGKETLTDDFTINGTNNSLRRFHINKYSQCPNDKAWFMVLVPGNDACSWGNRMYYNSPEIIYAPENGPVPMACRCNLGIASEFVLQLKFNVV